jgi:hypothetical protein
MCISLETNQDLLLDDIIKIDHRNNYIYVADRFSMYKFNENGNLLKKMNKLGPGSEEYLAISDFEIVNDDLFWILSRKNQTLYEFTWDGKLTNSIKLNYWASKMYLISPELLCLYIGNEMDNNNQHQLKIINLTTKELVSNQINIDKKKAHYLHVHSLNNFSRSMNNNMYYFNIFEDIIYTLNDDTISPVYHINIRNNNIPDSFFDGEYVDVQDFFQSLFNANYAYGTTLFVEYENAYLFSYYYDKICHFSFIRKETNESFIDCKTIIEDVVLLGYPVNLSNVTPFIQKNNELIFPIHPFDIIQYAESNMNLDDLNKIKQKIKFSDDDQNPVLLVLKM